MNELVVFENVEFGKMRIITRDREPWFVATDVCRALGIGNSRDATTKLDDDEKGVYSTQPPLEECKSSAMSMNPFFMLWLLADTGRAFLKHWLYREKKALESL